MALATINAHSSTGHVKNGNATFSTSRGAATGASTTNSTIYTGCELTGGNYDIYRLFYKFNTSSIPVGSIITGVALKIYLVSKDTTTDFTLGFTGHTAPDTTLTTADFDSLTLNTPTEYASRSANVSTLSTGAYLTVTLNSSGISALTPGSYYKIATRSGSRDIDNSAPLARSYVEIADAASGNPPQLVVTYTRPASFFMMF